MDIVEFLTARLDEDEAAARAAITTYDDGQWTYGLITKREDYEFYSIHTISPQTVEIAGSGFDSTGGVHEERFAAHITRWDPAHCLADVSAKRAMIALHAVEDERMHECVGSDPVIGIVTDYVANCQTLRLLVAPYADHPDYEPAWAIG